MCCCVKKVNEHIPINEKGFSFLKYFASPIKKNIEVIPASFVVAFGELINVCTGLVDESMT